MRLLARYQAMSFCCMRMLGGNVFTDPLPSNGYTSHNILPRISGYHNTSGRQEQITFEFRLFKSENSRSQRLYDQTVEQLVRIPLEVWMSALPCVGSGL
jgi:hypothetical protein